MVLKYGKPHLEIIVDTVILIYIQIQSNLNKQLGGLKY